MSDLQLPESLDIRHAGELHQSWNVWLAESTGPHELDVSATTRVDGTGLCLLLALVQQLARNNIAWQWRGESPALAAAIHDFGMAQHLQWASPKPAVEN